MAAMIEDDQDWESMPTLPENFVPSSYCEATKVTPTIEPNVYLADLKKDWSLGLVLHGGYLASLMAETSVLHFQTRHNDLHQGDIITCHVEFLKRSNVGSAEISIRELKLGSQFSVVAVQIRQIEHGQSRICVESIITMGNISREAKSGGITLSTRPISSCRPIPQYAACRIWIPDPRWIGRRPGAFKTDVYLPQGSNSVLAHPTFGPSVREQWVKWANNTGIEGFSVAHLLYLADAFRPLPEAYGLKSMWFPTLSYGLDIKKAPPSAKGWDRLFMRIEMNVAKHGRFDLSVTIYDKEGDLVAMGSHTALITGSRASYAPQSKI